MVDSFFFFIAVASRHPGDALPHPAGFEVSPLLYWGISLVAGLLAVAILIDFILPGDEGDRERLAAPDHDTVVGLSRHAGCAMWPNAGEEICAIQRGGPVPRRGDRPGRISDSGRRNGVNDKQLKGIRVISVADAEQLGTIERAYLDPESRRIVGFSFHRSGGFLQPESTPLVDTSDIQSFSADVLTVANPAMIRGKETAARYADLMDVDRLHGRQIFTEDGQDLGKIDSIEFDEHTYRLLGFEIGTGFFESPRPVLADDIVTIGQEVVVVRNTVVERRHAELPDAPTAPLGAHADHETTAPFQEQTIELPISGETLDVDRTIDEREEVVITKEAVERDETITGTVQHEEVHFDPAMDDDAAREQDREKGKRRP